MFRIFHIHGEEKKEIIPELGVYTVVELGEYIFEFEYKELVSENVFIEDLPVDRSLYSISSKLIYSKPFRFFEDYFGFSSMTINNFKIAINIQIQKLRQPEIEEILLFLWEKENRIFHNFFSKSSLKSKFDRTQNLLVKSSRFIEFAEKFHYTFSKLLTSFTNNPHTKLKREKKISDFSNDLVSDDSFDWILSNLDLVYFTSHNHSNQNVFKLTNSFGYLDKIEYSEKLRNFDTYENQIVVGAIQLLLLKLLKLKKDITTFSDNKIFSAENLDFRDLKKIPLFGLEQKISPCITKIQNLLNSYQKSLPVRFPKKEKPIPTIIFQKSYHYRKAFVLIKQMHEMKYQLGEELNLFNIKRLSTLYEIYNLFQIDQILDNKLIELGFIKSTNTQREDLVIDHFQFTKNDLILNLYYELRYPNGLYQTDLDVISTNNNKYLKPDFVIEIINKNKTEYYILDSKYTKKSTLQNNHLPDCIDKYIINTGIRNEQYKKPNLLALLYPGDQELIKLNNSNYRPLIKMVPSKPQQLIHLEEIIANIIQDSYSIQK